MQNKLCYILPKFDENIDEHYFHVLRLLEEIGRYIDVSLIIERSNGTPRLRNVKHVYPQRFGNSNKLARLLEIMYLTLRMRLSGYRKFFIRTSQTAAIPVSLVTKCVGGEVYLWRSGQGKEMIPGWSFNRDVLKEKLFSELTFKMALKLVDHFVTGPESMAGYFVKEWRVDPDKITVLYNDVDTKRFGGDSEGLVARQIQIRNDLGIAPHKKIVLMVHKLSPVRRTLKYLPRVIEDVVGRMDDVLFLLVGGGTEKPELEKQIADSGLQNYAITTGSLPNRDIQKYYACADVFIMPSYVEGFPRVLIEAMASGLPFVSTDAGGVRDLVTGEQQRFVVSKEDVDTFSERLLELLGNHDLRSRLGRGNREHVKKYSVENVAQMYISRLFPIRLHPLKGNLKRYTGQLVELDAYYTREMGNAYSHQRWGAEHFEKKLRGKEEYSRVAIDCNKRVVGFWIVSLSDESSLHTHRVAASREYRGRGLAKNMFDAICEQAREDGIIEMTISVSASNDRGVMFYEKLGFKRLEGESLISFMDKRDRTGKSLGDCIEEAGMRYYILAKAL